MRTPFDSSLLSGYLDGELDADETALVERVLDEQPERLRELETLRDLQRSLATLPAPQPTADPVSAVRKRIERQQTARSLASRQWWLRVTPFALAACLLLAVGWAMFGLQRESSPLASERAASTSSELSIEGGARLERADRAFDEDDLAFDQSRSRLPRQAESPAVPSRSAEAWTSRLRQQSDVGDGLRPASGELQRRSIARSESASPSMALAPEAGGSPAAMKQTESAAESERSSLGANRASPRALAREAAPADPGSGDPGSGDFRNRFRLRYEVPSDGQAEAVRWLRTIVPRELKELPASGEIKRYWFLADQQERQALQAAIKERVEVTGGDLKIVQSADAGFSPAAAAELFGPDVNWSSPGGEPSPAIEKLAEDELRAGDAVTPPTERSEARKNAAGMTAGSGGTPPAVRTAGSDARPTAVIIELLARPKR